MKLFLIILLLAFSTNLYAERDFKKDSRDVKAHQRAKEHPKGSGVGTNRYNVRYDKSYDVNDFKRSYRKCCNLYD